MKRDARRPPGGHAFEAVQTDYEGWMCLAPWVKTPEGYWYRPHVEANAGRCRGDEARAFCEHLAAQINAAMRAA